MTGDPGGAAPARRLELVPDRDGELAAALAAGDRALRDDGDLQASRARYERAYQLAEPARDTPAMARAALGAAGLWVHERRTVTGAAELEVRLRHVLGLLEDDEPLALRIRVRLAAEADYARGGHDEILALLPEARAAARPVPLAEALSLAHHCVMGPGHLAARRELSAELVRQSIRTGRRGDLLMGLLWQTVDAFAAGDPHASRLLRELRDHLETRPHLAVGFVVSAIDVMLAIRDGRFGDAESLAGVCAASGSQAGDIDSAWWPGAQLVSIRWYQGRLAELAPVLREQVHAPGLSAVDNSAVAALAVAAALAGDARTAASSLAALCGADLAALPRSSSWLVTMNGIVEAAWLLGDAAAAARAYELLRPHAALPMLGGMGITCFGVTSHALGVASLAAGQPHRAVEHLRDAVRRNLALAHWPAVAASRQRLAQALDLRGQPGDAAAARAELAAAAGEADPMVPRAAAVTAQCHRAGRKWQVVLGSRSVLVDDSIGMAHLAVLIANPRTEVQAAGLAAGLAALSSAGAGAAQPVLDHEAIAGYRRRLRDLDDEDAADRAERDWLLAQLAGAAGLGGRARGFPGTDERARVAVGKAARRAIARIAAADPVIGEHLRQSVHTGARCSYWPP